MFQHRYVVSTQRGMSGLGMLVTVAAVIGMVMLALRTIPHYIDFQTIGSIMDDLSAAQVREMEKRTIVETLQKRFKINNVRSMTVKDVLSIERNNAGTTIVVDYEIREPLVGNIEIVLVFNETYSYH